MNISKEEQQSIRNRSAKPLLFLAIIAMSMVFAGLTSAYVVRSGDPGWLKFDLPKIFFISTALIATSSLTMIWALKSASKDETSLVKIGMLLTLLLGLGFMVSQFLAWKSLVEQGIYLAGKTSNAAGQFLYVISGIHLLHLLGGIFMLIFVSIKSFKGLYHSKNLLGLQLCSIYWHFLDLLWIYLFTFLYFTH